MSTSTEADERSLMTAVSRAVISNEIEEIMRDVAEKETRRNELGGTTKSQKKERPRDSNNEL